MVLYAPCEKLVSYCNIQHDITVLIMLLSLKLFKHTILSTLMNHKLTKHGFQHNCKVIQRTFKILHSLFQVLSSATLLSPPFLALSFFLLNPLLNIFSHFCSKQTLRGGSPLGFCSYSFFHLFLQFLPLSLINRLVSNLDKETKIKSHL